MHVHKHIFITKTQPNSFSAHIIPAWRCGCIHKERHPAAEMSIIFACDRIQIRFIFACEKSLIQTYHSGQLAERGAGGGNVVLVGGGRADNNRAWSPFTLAPAVPNLYTILDQGFVTGCEELDARERQSGGEGGRSVALPTPSVGIEQMRE